MNPVCEVPGCEKDAEARVTFFHPDYGGGIGKDMCVIHWALLLKVLPELLQNIAKQVP